MPRFTICHITEDLFKSCQAEEECKAYPPFSKMEEFLARYSRHGIQHGLQHFPPVPIYGDVYLELSLTHLRILAVLEVYPFGLRKSELAERVWSTGDGSQSQDLSNQQAIEGDLEILERANLVQNVGQVYSSRFGEAGQTQISDFEFDVHRSGAAQLYGSGPLVDYSSDNSTEEKEGDLGVGTERMPFRPVMSLKRRREDVIENGEEVNAIEETDAEESEVQSGSSQGSESGSEADASEESGAQEVMRFNTEEMVEKYRKTLKKVVKEQTKRIKDLQEQVDHVSIQLSGVTNLLMWFKNQQTGILGAQAQMNGATQESGDLTGLVVQGKGLMPK